MERVRGERALITGMLVDAVGTGMYVPFSLVFFQRVTGLSLTVIGAALTAAGLLGMAALPLTGAAIDRFGAHRCRQVVYLVRALGFLAFPLGTTPAAFAAIALVTSAGERAFPATQQALIGEISQGAQRDRLLALGRSVANAGLGAGGLLAALVITLAGDSGFLIAAWINAASFLAAALLAARVRPGKTDRAAVRTKTRYSDVLKDRPFAGLTAANFLIALGYAALSMLLPAYAVEQLDLSDSIAGPLFAVNTALCAFAGLPVGRLARRARRRTRVAAVGGLIFTGAFAGFALIDGLPRHVLVVALFGLLVVYTVGELVHNPSAGALSVGAAPEDARGRYLATYQLSWGLSSAVAPSLFTALLAVDGRLPWLALAMTSTAGSALLVWLEPRLPADAVYTTPPAPVAESGASQTQPQPAADAHR
ncbi:MFS transporter [Yinghuangia seranimata]|uniref:MFS transporter n=1 Tax=Yinghuangia seranimata TaxID=408067 RepID=UPI00248A9887|nr:MFS transporter [Yinghuangia seranimata]MDI2126498.1 MFS transporter [Yinghuangia seranimata]